ncbi:DUF3800 domain-containing protein [Chloroflexus aggregans]|uniref:DUF3800 domain-containing protein n=1 Tax=Chloroflexus aggregans (strain MD-66 / DSM 9485) TaxID=326427 RepID=B8G891_CHLAD|nr:DUF3800 domain-containing protein [Chloroflexus aggregans]ACL26145.1 conserved hypothetical protein [Chloroflexus aggregans DSM 9485]
MNSNITHVGFADESYWNTGRFRSLGMVTLPLDCLQAMESEVRQLLDESQVKEFKWKKLDGAKERFAAEKLCRFAVDKACAGQFRVDVLVWDIEDSRHKIARRDDIANLGRMYYHLFRNVLRARWPNDALWRLCPDEHTAQDWRTLQDYLKNKSTSTEVDCSLFTGGQFRIRLQREFGIQEIQAVSSWAHPLLQLADLFAGLAVFSRDKFDDYQKWLQATSPQVRLFDEGNASDSPSRSSLERFQVLKMFDCLCKQRKLGVSLETKRGLWTPKPENPINFWIYEPQHSEDKAPQKERR